jgi:hypothetical protein
LRISFRWGLGPIAQKKKVLIKEGKLDKYGRKNEKTPADYLQLQGSGSTVGLPQEPKSEKKTDKKTVIRFIYLNLSLKVNYKLF